MTDHAATSDSAVARVLAGEVGPDEIDLSIGEPDQPIPGELIDVAVRSLRDGVTGYTPKRGLTSLREALVLDTTASTGHRPGVEDVVVTLGGTGAVAVALAAVCAAGAATAGPVLVPNPGWPNYRMLAERLGVPVLPYRQLPGAAGFCDLDEIARGLRLGARLVVVNSPSNPTGAVAAEATLAAVVELARAAGAYVLSDEAYESVLLRGGRAPSPLAVGGDVVLAARTFSKTYSMTGMRVGSLVVPPQLRTAAAALHGTMVGCAPITAQVVALEALRLLPARGASLVSTYRARFAAATRALGPWFEADGLDDLGGFYAWVDARRTGRTSWELCTDLRDRGIVASSGQVYTEDDGYIRLALTVPDDVLDGALHHVREVLDSHAASGSAG